MLFVLATCNAESNLDIHSDSSEMSDVMQDSMASEPMDNVRGNSTNRGGHAMLTFDDGPHPQTTPLLLKQLKSAGVEKAIFFLVGDRITKYPDLVKTIDSAGYAIGYHSMNHRNQVGMTAKEINEDIQRFKLVLNNVLKKRYQLEYARPPFGGMSTQTAKIFLKLEKEGKLHTKNIISPQFVQKIVANKIRKVYMKNRLKIFLWNIDFNDWEQRIDLKHAKNKFNSSKEQYWLFHEMPMYKNKVFDNHITEDMPKLLKIICSISIC